MTRRYRYIVTPLLAVVGVQFWLIILRGNWGYYAHLKLLLLACVAAIIPPVNRLAWRVLRIARRPSRWTRRWIALGVTLISAAILCHYELTCGRQLFPIMHDEFQFLLQARMVASGRLWMPGHPLADFFDTFYVLLQPKYAAQSFPGTAILYAPSIWLGVPAWMWGIGLASVTVGLMYRVTAELIDGLAGLLAAALLLELSLFRYVATMVLAQTPMVVLGLLMIWAYLRWREKRLHQSRMIWALVLGAISGFMVITRPADALIFIVPAGIAVLFDLKRRPLRWALTVGLVAIGALPWLGLQLVFNHGVTGNWLTTPFKYYNERDQPSLGYGLHLDAGDQEPASRLLEKRQFYDAVTKDALRRHTPGMLWKTFLNVRLPVTISSTLAQPMLLVLLPMGVLAWRVKRAWVLASGLPLFLLIYTPYPIFTSHYPIVAAPAVIVLLLLGAKAIVLAWPRLRAGVWTGLTIFVGGLFITPAVDIYPMVLAMIAPNNLLKTANTAQAVLEANARPAVLLFLRDPNESPETEPVYNLDTPWPDDAMVIRAHDRGADNRQLYRYYAAHGDRLIYRFDESRVDGTGAPPGDPLTFVGLASELATTIVGQTSTSERESGVTGNSPTGSRP